MCSGSGWGSGWGSGLGSGWSSNCGRGADGGGSGSSDKDVSYGCWCEMLWTTDDELTSGMQHNDFSPHVARF